MTSAKGENKLKRDKIRSSSISLNMNTSAFNGVASFAEGLLKRPANLVENQENRVVTSSLSMMKSLHDILVTDSAKFKIKNENLVVSNMNDDQIWEQLTIHLNVLDK